MALVPRAGRKSNSASPPARPLADGASARKSETASARDFEAVLDRYEKPIFNFIYRTIGDYAEAEDLTQETFIAAFKAFEQFRGDSNVHTWLRRIAYNNCKNRFKQRDRQREFEGASLDAGMAFDEGEDGAGATREVPDWSYSPARLLERKELRALIERAIDSLAPEYKVVLLLCDQENLSYNEIVEITGLSLAAVKTRLNRARAMVRKKVEPYYRP